MDTETKERIERLERLHEEVGKAVLRLEALASPLQQAVVELISLAQQDFRDRSKPVTSPGSDD